ncbi:MAG: hypothetical protein ACON4U_14440 [Myxococcota bacterium]
MLFSFISVLFTSCQESKSLSDSDDPVPSSPPDSPVLEDSAVPLEPDDTAEPTDPIYASDKAATQSIDFVYNRNVTNGNPLKGFVTSIENWGQPANDFPLSLEFAYVPLSALVVNADQYDFGNGFEPLIDASASRNHHIILRVYIDYPNLNSGLPSYLNGVIDCEPYSDYGGGCSPDYSDPELQSAILNFISAFGSSYDGDPRIAFVQLGLLGFWGEWHTYPHTDWFPDDTFQQSVISAFDEAFEVTPLQIRYPSQDTPQRDIGFHDDSYAYATVGTVEWFFWNRVLASGAELNWMRGPMGGEVYPPLQTALFSDTYAVDTYSQDFESITDTTHATFMLNYAAFNMNGTGYQGEQRNRAEQAAMQMGYEYTLEQAAIEASGLNGDTVDITVTAFIRNTGVSPFYYPLSLELTAIETGEVLHEIPGVELLLPETESTALVFSLEDISVADINQSYGLMLKSDHLLPQQHIRWANETQQEGQMRLSPLFQCIYATESIWPGQEVQGSNGPCTCDVNGTFYTYSGEICQLD